MDSIKQIDWGQFTGLEVENLTPEELEKINAEWEEQQKREAQEERKKRLEEHYRNTKESGINKRYLNESIETFKAETENEKKNKFAVQNYIEGKGRQMLLLLGKYGTGKTHLGCAVIRAMGGRFISSFELCTLYEMGADFNATQNRLEVLQYFSNIENLVIDEIGRGKTEIEKLILPYIINARYEKELPLVLISNLEKNKVMGILGGATIDRLSEICSTLNFTGESHRK